MTPTLQPFLDSADHFARILADAASQWDAPTPCEDWTVRDVVRHLIETERDFLLKRDLILGSAPDLDDPAQAWADHSVQVSEVLDLAGVGEREYDGYFGRTTVAATMADFYGWDLAIHGWDVARATGQTSRIDDAEAGRLSDIADGWGEALHGEGICGPALAVDENATAVERLLSRLGRDPHWAA